SLLDQTARLVVRRQRAYGAAHGVPWGISESAYNVRDLELTYQYSNFGVPGLGLERGLSEDLVIAPYATGLAAMIDPGAAARNFVALAGAGARGSLGFYEALDYTRTRLPEGTEVAVVRAYMAHHQGMTLVALTNVLRTGAMRARFHAEPIVQATELLLQERAPRSVAGTGPRVAAVEADSYEVTFSEDRAEFRRRDGTITTTLDVVVSPEDDAEIRRVTLMNLGAQAREIELTSYCELVLAPAAADAAHPAFSNLFVQTESVPELVTLLASRRPRAAGDPRGWAAHVALGEALPG